LLRDISKANAPGIRTFLTPNVYDCDDQTGEIKFAWSALGGAKGNNLYALTDRGCCLLMTNKTTLSDATGNPIGLSSSDRVIGDEQWISIDIGMNNEMWRSRAEYNNMLFFANLTSAYMLADNQLADIGREGYHAMLYNNFLRTIDGNYSAPAGAGVYVTGVFDTYHNEYLLQINIDDAPQGAYLMAYSVRNKSWNGRYTYGYDYYLGYDINQFIKRRFVRLNFIFASQRPVPGFRRYGHHQHGARRAAAGLVLGQRADPRVGRGLQAGHRGPSLRDSGAWFPGRS
jgi:hypothetical protein